MTSQEVIDTLKADGWVLNRVKGSHHIFTHPTKGGHVTVPHPRKDMALVGRRDRIANGLATYWRSFYEIPCSCMEY